MRIKKKKPVDPRQATLIIRALQSFPADEPGVSVWGESYAGAPFIRFSTVTGGVPWLVDIYGHGYCRVQVGSCLSQIHQSIPSIMRYLFEKLRDLV